MAQITYFLFFQAERTKLLGVFFFSMLHGLGFAELLTEIRMPEERFISTLISFNIGIEIGQIIIVGVTLPFIYYFKEKTWYPRFVQVSALAMTGFEIFLGIERITGG